MRLFLSSEGFGKYPERLIELVGANKKVIFINNAKDYMTPDERAASSNEKRAEFDAIGLEFEEVDLRDYFASHDGLKERIASAGVVWCAGGNTFILRRALAYSGADRILYSLVRKNVIAYGGSSAGSIVATPSLHGTELGDEPDELPEGYAADIIWNGLDFVSIHLVPHYESEWFGAKANMMAKSLRERKLQFEVLRDGQVMLVDGEKQEILL